MVVPVSKLLPATVVVATMVLGFKVVALATTSSDAGQHSKLATAATTQTVQMPRRSAQLASSDQPEGGYSSAPPRVVRIPVVPAALSTPLRILSDTRAADQTVSIQGVSSQSAAPAGQAPFSGAAGAFFGMPASVPLSPPAQTTYGASLTIPTAAPPPTPLEAPLAQVAPAKAAPEPALRAAATPAGESIPGPDALKVRRSQIEERERALVEREALAEASERRLSDRVGELTVLQAKLQALETGLKERDEANWSGMVKVYEVMRPKDAASIFNALDKPVLIEIMDRMKPAKATPIIAAMDPEKARQLTADLAARRTRSTTATN